MLCLLKTLFGCRLAELLQSKKSDTAQETANNLHALIAGGGKKKASASVSVSCQMTSGMQSALAGWLAGSVRSKPIVTQCDLI